VGRQSLSPSRWTAPAPRADTHRMRGAYGIRIRTQLYLKCNCACRRHQGCHCRETETSVRLRFLGSFQTSQGLPVVVNWYSYTLSTIAESKN
jgi:hypothetical protein